MASKCPLVSVREHLHCAGFGGGNELSSTVIKYGGVNLTAQEVDFWISCRALSTAYDEIKNSHSLDAARDAFKRAFPYAKINGAVSPADMFIYAIRESGALDILYKKIGAIEERLHAAEEQFLLKLRENKLGGHDAATIPHVPSTAPSSLPRNLSDIRKLVRIVNAYIEYLDALGATPRKKENSDQVLSPYDETTLNALEEMPLIDVGKLDSIDDIKHVAATLRAAEISICKIATKFEEQQAEWANLL